MGVIQNKFMNSTYICFILLGLGAQELFPAVLKCPYGTRERTETPHEHALSPLSSLSPSTFVLNDKTIKLHEKVDNLWPE